MVWTDFCGVQKRKGWLSVSTLPEMDAEHVFRGWPSDTWDSEIFSQSTENLSMSYSEVIKALSSESDYLLNSSSVKWEFFCEMGMLMQGIIGTPVEGLLAVLNVESDLCCHNSGHWGLSSSAGSFEVLLLAGWLWWLAQSLCVEARWEECSSNTLALLLPPPNTGPLSRTAYGPKEPPGSFLSRWMCKQMTGPWKSGLWVPDRSAVTGVIPGTAICSSHPQTCRISNLQP